MDFREFVDLKNIIAVVGVSHDPSKYGHIIFFDLLRAGYRVHAVHRDGGMIEGFPRYRELRSLPEKPDVVCFVVPPVITERMLEECKELGIGKVWMQPGAGSDKAVEFCERNGIAAVNGPCIMVEKMIKR